MKLTATEFQMQSALMCWAQAHEVCSKFLFHIPNGGKMPTVTKNGRTYCPAGARLKKLGVKSGIPDLFLAYPRGKYSGLFIELKVGDNKCSKMQEDMLKVLDEVGYKCEVVFDDWIKAKDKIEQYLCSP